jgi:hypothetical protein
MGSCVTLYKVSFRKTGSDNQKLTGKWTDTQTQKQQGDLKSLPLFFQNKEMRIESEKRTKANLVKNNRKI